MLTHTGDGLVLGGQPRPILRERSLNAAQFWGFSLLMPAPFYAERPNSTTDGFLEALPRSCPKGGGAPALPDFGAFSLLIATRFDVERPNSA